MIGVLSDKSYRCNRLVSEHLLPGSYHKQLITRHDKSLNIVLYSRRLDVLLISDENGQLFQYDLSPGRSFSRLQKRYTGLSLGKVVCGALTGHLAILGGEFGIKVIDLGTRTVLGGRLQTSIRLIQSLTLCPVSATRVLLAVGGQYPDYSKSSTDLFDVTDLVTKSKFTGCDKRG